MFVWSWLDYKVEQLGSWNTPNWQGQVSRVTQVNMNLTYHHLTSAPLYNLYGERNIK